MLSIWEKETFYAPQDIIIIGGGLLGLWTAWELKQRNSHLQITIVEKGHTPLGASTRNAGFACFGSPTELLQDAATMGIDAMLQLVEMRWKGIEKIRKHFTDAESGFDHCGGYECLNRHYAGWPELDAKTAWLNDLLKEITGDKTVFQRSDHKLPALGLQGFDALIENATEAALHSGKLVRALMQKVQSAGVQILYGMEVTGWERSDSGINLFTTRQITIAAKQLLSCTNGFTQTLLPELAIVPARGQVLVTSPIENLSMKGTFHFDEGFYYWRNLGNRILIGGARNAAFEEEHTTDFSGSVTVKKALETFLRSHLDASYQYNIDYHWSGIMGFTIDKKPFAARVADCIFAAVACNGMGVALTPVIAEQAAGLMADQF